MKYRRLATVLAGGSGERFWPLSRPERPKQLLRLTHPDQSMLEEAVRRIEPLFGRDGIFVSTGSTIAAQVRQAGIVAPEQVLVEPGRRNTLGAIVWFMAHVIAHSEGPTSVAIVTADHKIAEPERFRSDIATALAIAESGGGVGTLGIRPGRPETGFGYIEVDPKPNAAGSYRALRFLEKPNPATAERFVASGNTFWNGGMFFWTVAAFEDELRAANPEAHACLVAMAGALREQDLAGAEEAFLTLPNLSIDYALMERASRVFVVPASFPWDDVGAWDALPRTLPGDADGNVTQGETLAVDSQGCVIVNEGGARVVALLGVQDLVVVSTPEGVLVCPKSMAQRVKEIAARVGPSDPA